MSSGVKKGVGRARRWGIRKVDLALVLGRPKLMGSEEEKKGISVLVNV